LLRGRRETDFRPGMPLTDYRIDYHLDAGGEQMSVVGHVQQLRLSACYQKSDLTCLTCHDPHAAERPADRTELYRQKCLTCHAPRGCAVPAAERRQRQPADDCSACHMPRGDTDIPHVAATHHRIGRHGPPPKAKGPTGTPVPVPDADLSHLGPVENRRNLGIAYWNLLENQYPEFVRHHAAFRERAHSNLEAAYAAGLRDGLTVVGLAECSWPTDPDRAGAYAEEALRAPDLTPEGRARALAVLSDYRLRENDFPAAIRLLEDLVRRRRYGEDWHLLGFAYLRDHRPEKALAALRQALAIRPTRPDVHAALADVYGLLGEPGRARDHRQKAEWLILHHQD
ncbi:MAG TPA: tetratricopeptide repeat protein, partial [Gemmataceae bacterium]|nr:tetratricopeptide repeat protein [Gemmataceae bacterium]